MSRNGDSFSFIYLPVAAAHLTWLDFPHLTDMSLCGFSIKFYWFICLSLHQHQSLLIPLASYKSFNQVLFSKILFFFSESFLLGLLHFPINLKTFISIFEDFYYNLKWDGVKSINQIWENKYLTLKMEYIGLYLRLLYVFQ